VRTVKSVAYLTKAQITELKRQSDAHCRLYNECLTEKEAQYQATKKSDLVYDQIKRFIPVFRLKPENQGCNYSSLQQTIRRLHKAYARFFKKKGKKTPLQALFQDDRIRKIRRRMEDCPQERKNLRLYPERWKCSAR
jgi:transposase